MKTGKKLIIVFILFAMSCSEKENEIFSKSSSLAITEVDSGDIVINEYSVKEALKNEFGKKADWFELYNTTENDIFLENGKWTISDNPSNPEKCFLPPTTIKAGEHVIVWCDNEKKAGNDIHANFKLSSKGESINLYCDGKLMDRQKYDSLTVMIGSVKRETDGSKNWVKSSVATPGRSN